jgi:hypothetical protein
MASAPSNPFALRSRPLKPWQLLSLLGVVAALVLGFVWLTLATRQEPIPDIPESVRQEGVGWLE